MQRLKAKTQSERPIHEHACKQEHNLVQPILGVIKCGIQPVVGVMCTKCGYVVMFKPIQQQGEVESRSGDAW